MQVAFEPLDSDEVVAPPKKKRRTGSAKGTATAVGSAEDDDHVKANEPLDSDEVVAPPKKKRRTGSAKGTATAVRSAEDDDHVKAKDKGRKRKTVAGDLDIEVEQTEEEEEEEVGSLPCFADRAPNGAANLPEVLLTLRKICFDLVEYAQDKPLLKAAIEQFVRNGLLTSSNYSGCGTMEVAAVMLYDFLMEALRMARSECRGVVCWSACDTDADSQLVLDSHPRASRALHQFDNVLDRLFPQDLEVCTKILNGKLQWYAVFQGLEADGLMTSTALTARKHRLGAELLAELSSVLSKCEFKTRCWCRSHLAECPVSPRSDPNVADMFWVEGAGTTCTPWSGMNKESPKWLDACTLPLLCWAFSTRYYEPDAVLQECTPRFPEQDLDDIFSCDEELLKCVCSRPHTSSHTSLGATYTMNVAVNSPVCFGVPSKRVRQYLEFLLTSSARQLPEVPWEQICYRNLAVSARAYIVGPADNNDEVVSAACLARWEDYACSRQCKALRGRDETDWRVEVALANVSQHSDFGGISTAGAPALLRNSILVDLVQGRVLRPESEHWLIQGFPHHACAQLPAPLAKYWPPRTTKALSKRVCRRLTGNSMHIVQIGASLLHVAACTQKLYPCN